MPAHVLVLARAADRYLVDNKYHLHLVMQKNSIIEYSEIQH